MSVRNIMRVLSPHTLSIVLQLAVIAMLVEGRADGGDNKFGNHLVAADKDAAAKGPEGDLLIDSNAPPAKSAVAVVFERIFQALAIASNIALQLSPMRVILEIRRYKDTRGSDGLPYLMIFCVATQWTYYASFAIAVTGNASLQMIIFGNVFGVLLGAFYTYSFQKNCNDQVRANKMKLFYKIAAFVFITETITICFLKKQTGMFILGLVGTVTSVGCTAAPLTELSVVMKTRDTSTWPTDFIYVNSVGLLVWVHIIFIQTLSSSNLL